MVTTNNNNSLSYFPTPRPPVHAFAFPQVRNPGRLYEVHQAIVGHSTGVARVATRSGMTPTLTSSGRSNESKPAFSRADTIIWMRPRESNV